MRKLSVILLLLLSLFPAFAEEYSFLADDLALTADTARGELVFSAEGNEWPLYADRPMIGSYRLRGAQRVRSQSLFSITAIAPRTGRIVTLNTDVADETEYTPLDNGLSISYSFEEGIGFTAVFTVGEDGLHVSADTSDFIESEELVISSIEFLPFFGACSARDLCRLRGILNLNCPE